MIRSAAPGLSREHAGAPRLKACGVTALPTRRPRPPREYREEHGDEDRPSLDRVLHHRLLKAPCQSLRLRVAAYGRQDRTNAACSGVSIQPWRLALVRVMASAPFRPASRRRQATTVPVRPSPPRQATTACWPAWMRAEISPRSRWNETTSVGTPWSTIGKRMRSIP